MANAWGGVVVFGVDDRSGEIVGMPSDKARAVEAWVREVCNDAIEPVLDAMIDTVEVPGLDGALSQ